MLARIPKNVLRGLVVLELAGVAYLATFALLNAPAYAAQVRFALNGNDLSRDLAGAYIPIEQIPGLSAAGQSGQFPYVQVDVGRASSVGGRATAASLAASPPQPIDPATFVPNTVTVPRIGVRAPIVQIATNTEHDQQSGLEHGVIHYYGTPAVGQPGNAFYAGHSSDWLFKPGGYKTVFALLPDLKRGDYFVITDASTMFYFTVSETVVVSPSDTSVLDRCSAKDKQVCASLQTSYPVGTAAQRYVVVGHLERTVHMQ